MVDTTQPFLFRGLGAHSLRPKKRPHDRRQSSGSISIHVKRRVASFVPPFVSWSVPLLVVAAAAEDEVANQGGIEDLFLSAFARFVKKSLTWEM